MEDFALVSRLLAESGSTVVFAKLDAVNNPSTASQYSIKGFPALLFFTNGTFQRYTSGHSREEMVNWVRKRTGFAATTISTKAEAEAFLNKNVAVVISYFEKFEGPEYEEFIAAAIAEEGTEFLQTTNVDIVQLFIKPPFIALRKPQAVNFAAFGGHYSESEILSFVELNKHPLVSCLNSTTARRVYSSPIKHHVLLFAESKDYEALRDLYQAVAKDFNGKVMFLVVDLADEDFSRPMLAVYGLQTDKPAVAGFHNEDGSRYLLDSEITLHSLKAFAADFLEGKLPLYYKSQPVPTENVGLVTTIVGKTFDLIVLDETKDVFLQVYTPWCVACEKVNRTFEKLARYVEGVPSLVLARIDASANEHPLLKEVLSFPSLLFFPARKSSIPIVAPERPSFKGLLQFVKENAAIPFVSLKEEAKSKKGAAQNAEITSSKSQPGEEDQGKIEPTGEVHAALEKDTSSDFATFPSSSLKGKDRNEENVAQATDSTTMNGENLDEGQPQINSAQEVVMVGSPESDLSSELPKDEL
ncbi:hypothetical protein CY35_16G085300 [Sphagnum magellanicum]|nr:hypothetical protein CY35_16G085300 [Sphagnum magellanicum]